MTRVLVADDMQILRDTLIAVLDLEDDFEAASAGAVTDSMRSPIASPGRATAEGRRKYPDKPGVGPSCEHRRSGPHRGRPGQAAAPARR